MKEAVKMKVIVLFGILAAMFAGCSNKEETEKREAKHHTELMSALDSRDSVEAVMKVSLDEIDRRLELIKKQQGYIAYNNKRDVKNKKEEILNNIAMMDELIKQNREEMDKLRDELKAAGSKNKEIRKRIAKYEAMNKSMGLEMEDLRKELIAERERNLELTANNEKLNIELSNQNVVYDNLKTQYTKAESDAYTAYIAKGTRKELKRENVLEKKKLLEVAAADRLNSNAPTENFEKVDTRTTLEIPVSAKDAKIVTSHSKDSYKWIEDEEGMKRLCITDPQEFWQKSKYLVIETK
jgi:hypothetical protein